MKTGLLLFFLSLAAPVFAGEVETVLLVSIDALHPAALSEKTSPTLVRLMHSGRSTLEGRSVTPPQIMAASHDLPPPAPGVFHITELKRLLHNTLGAAEK